MNQVKPILLAALLALAISGTLLAKRLHPPVPKSDIEWLESGSLMASYGESCKDAKPAMGNNTYHAGNATDFVLHKCVDSNNTCSFFVELRKLGDPANGCGKDFKVSWRCKGEARESHVYLADEASDKRVTISCRP